MKYYKKPIDLSATNIVHVSKSVSTEKPSRSSSSDTSENDEVTP